LPTTLDDGAYIKMQGGSIELGMPGEFTAKASRHNLVGPGSLDSARPHLPLPRSGSYRGLLTLVDRQRQHQPDIFYKVVSAKGQVLASGVTDEQGKSIEVRSEDGAPATAYIGKGGWTVSEADRGSDEGCGC